MTWNTCPYCNKFQYQSNHEESFLYHLAHQHPDVKIMDSNPQRSTVFPSNTPTKSILEEAQEVIYGDREKTYGDPSANLKRIAEYWQVYLTQRGITTGNIGHKISVNDVCNLMILLKVARLINDPKHRDSKVDIAGYAALMQRCIDTNASPSPKEVSANRCGND